MTPEVKQNEGLKNNFPAYWPWHRAMLPSCFSRVRLCATPWTVAYQAPPSLGSPGKITGVGCHFLLQCMKWKVKVKSLSRVRLCATPWTVAYQAPPSLGFSRQDHWSGLPLLSPAPGHRPSLMELGFHQADTV